MLRVCTHRYLYGAVLVTGIDRHKGPHAQYLSATLGLENDFWPFLKKYPQENLHTVFDIHFLCQDLCHFMSCFHRTVATGVLLASGVRLDLRTSPSRLRDFEPWEKKWTTYINKRLGKLTVPSRVPHMIMIYIYIYMYTYYVYDKLMFSQPKDQCISGVISGANWGLWTIWRITSPREDLEVPALPMETLHPAGWVSFPASVRWEIG